MKFFNSNINVVDKIEGNIYQTVITGDSQAVLDKLQLLEIKLDLVIKILEIEDAWKGTP